MPFKRVLRFFKNFGRKPATAQAVAKAPVLERKAVKRKRFKPHFSGINLVPSDCKIIYDDICRGSLASLKDFAEQSQNTAEKRPYTLTEAWEIWQTSFEANARSRQGVLFERDHSVIKKALRLIVEESSK